MQENEVQPQEPEVTESPQIQEPGADAVIPVVPGTEAPEGYATFYKGEVFCLKGCYFNVVHIEPNGHMVLRPMSDEDAQEAVKAATPHLSRQERRKLQRSMGVR